MPDNNFFVNIVDPSTTPTSESFHFYLTPVAQNEDDVEGCELLQVIYGLTTLCPGIVG